MEDSTDTDPLRLGSTPTKSTNQSILALLLNENKFFKQNFLHLETLQSDLVHGSNERDPDNPFDDTKVFLQHSTDI